MTTETDRERRFWLEKRHALIIELDAIEERYLPDRRADTVFARELLRKAKLEKANPFMPDEDLNGS